MKKYIKIICCLILFTVFIGVQNVFAATSFLVNRKAMKLYDSFDLKEILNTTSQNLSFTSDNTSAVTVTNDGIITAQSFGQAVVTVNDGTNTASIIISSGFYNGFDISTYNGNVDWLKVKQEGMDFVMIRSSFGWYDDADKAAGKAYNYQFDKQLANNLKGASNANIPFGIYHYSYADTIEEAELEAEYVITLLNKYYPEYAAKMSLPIAYDVENANQQAVGKQQTTEQIIAFANKVKAAGYDVIVYANNNFFVNYIDTPRLHELGFKFWYARYFYTTNLNKIRTIGDYGYIPYIYQYTEAGAVNGAVTSSGATDMNVMYMPERYKIRIVDEKGNQLYMYGIDKGEPLGELPEFPKDGYVQVGYQDDQGSIVTSETYPFTDAVLTPVYEKNTIDSISFESKEIRYEVKTQGTLPNITCLPENIELDLDSDVTFELDKEGVISLNDDRTYEIIGEGTVVVKCYLKSNPDVFDTYTITYELPKVNSISFVEKTRNHSRPVSDRLPEITYIPENASFKMEDVTFELDKEGIIVLNDDLSYNVVGEGKVNVKCILKENNTVFDNLEITVEYIYDKGDLNKDFKINSTDAALCLELFSNGKYTENELKIADMNDDGKINSTDAAIILEIFSKDK